MSTDIRKNVCSVVAKQLNVEEVKVTDTASFVDDLGADSCSTREGTKICGSAFGLDNNTQITTIGSGIPSLSS